MHIGLQRLGSMGAHIVRRLMKNGHECVVYTRTRAKVQDLPKGGCTWVNSK